MTVMMMQLKTKGLILKVVNLNDNYRLFTIQTTENGKITAIAKGVRSHMHKDFSALGHFCYSDFVLDAKTNLYYISSAEVINNFYDIRTSVEKVSYATYFMDVVNNISDSISGDDEYFRFVLNTLYMLGCAEKYAEDDNVSLELRKLKAIFEMKTACFLGYEPYVDGCIKCSGKKNLNSFDVENGGIICDSCLNDNKCVISGDIETFRTLYKIVRSDYKSVFKVLVDDDNIDELNAICEKYLLLKLDYYFSSLDYLKTIAYIS